MKTRRTNAEPAPRERKKAKRGPAWTTADLDHLKELVDQGYGYAVIARRLKRSEMAVRVKAKRIKYRLLHSRAALTCREVGRLLGLPCSKTVARWIEAYGLRARNARPSGCPLWRVQWEDLCDWLDDPAHWMAYDPARCTEPPLREHLTEIRAGEPRWLRPGEVAERYIVDSGTVKQWIAKGFLPATRYGNWWVRESDLADFVPPFARSKAGIPKSCRRIVTGPDRIVAGPPVERKAA